MTTQMGFIFVPPNVPPNPNFFGHIWSFSSAKVRSGQVRSGQVILILIKPNGYFEEPKADVEFRHQKTVLGGERLFAAGCVKVRNADFSDLRTDRSNWRLRLILLKNSCCEAT
jgi:hypothetical protein